MLLFFPNLLFFFIFFSALFFGSVEPNNGQVAFVWGNRRETATTHALDEKIAEGYEIVSIVKNDGNYNNLYLWTLVKKKEDNKNNNQIDALGQKLDTHSHRED
ncbi:hypothetical protein niasHT_021087 [Heterodera trifolii]|uniref:Uncharacterized protein n=1 Tax=Heterodera trifolii TaxID=157864 RepID=A0ABD2KDM5_9BILA